MINNNYSNLHKWKGMTSVNLLTEDKTGDFHHKWRCEKCGFVLEKISKVYKGQITSVETVNPAPSRCVSKDMRD